MSVFVLVHGGATGGWIWSQVTPFLRKSGHEVFTPTLTGLGERGHLANPEVGLATHIQDIVGVLECENLNDVILLGYSYGVMPVTGAAEKVPERISRLVFLDAAPPTNGLTWFDVIGPEVSQLFTGIANREGDGWRFPLSKDTPRWQPHPLKTCTDNIEVTNPEAVKIPRAFIHCQVREEGAFSPMFNRFDTYMEEVKQQGNWYRAIDADHFVALTKPKELSDILLELG